MGFPLTTRLTTLRSLAFRRAAGRRASRRVELLRVRDAYLSRFTAFATKAVKVRLSTAAPRSVPDELDFAVRGWLRALLE